MPTVFRQFARQRIVKLQRYVEDLWIQYLIPLLASVQPPPVQDWPNPRRPARGPADQWVQGLLTTTLAPGAPAVTYQFRAPTFVKIVAISGVAALTAQPASALLQTTLATTQPPFVQTDWPNPARRLSAQMPVVYRPDVQPAAAVPAPFAQTEWANPTRARPQVPDWIAGPNLLRLPHIIPPGGSWLTLPPLGQRPPTLAGSLSQVPSTIPSVPPVLPIDWPNPRGAPQPALTWTSSGVLRLPHIIPPGEALFELPPRGPQPIALFWSQSGVLQLPVSGALPPGLSLGFDPRPRAPARVPQSYRPATAAPAPPSGTPFVPPDWSNPRVRPVPVELRTWLGILAYLGFDRFYGEPGQVPTHVLPNPLRPAPYRHEASLGRIPTTIALAAPQPFTPRDWTNPRVRTRLVQDWFSPVLRAAFRPCPAYDWPNPQRPTWRETGWIDSQIPPLPPVAPFSQLTWPNPIRLGPRTDWIDAQIPPPPEQLAFTQATWPVLPGPRPLHLGWVQTQVPSQIVLTAPPPFAQLAWSNPWGRSTRADWIAAQLPSRIIPAPLPLIQQYDWPNPALHARPSDWIQSQIPIPVPPFIQTEWPNPVRVPTREWGQIAPLSFLHLQTLFGAPGYQTNWPNPLVARRETGWIAALSPSLPAQTLPFGITSFPSLINLGYGPRPPAVGWLQSQIPPPTVVPFIPHTWPNPASPAYLVELRSWLGILPHLGFGGAVGTVDLADSITLGDRLQVVPHHAPRPPGNWINPPRLPETPWIPTPGLPCCPKCGLTHVGPQGCNAEMVATLSGDALTLSDALDVVFIPGEVDAAFATGFEEGPAAGEALSPGAKSALFTQKSPNFDGMPYIVSDFVHAGGSYSWQVNAAHCQRGMTKNFASALAPPYTFSFKAYLYLVGPPAGNSPTGLIDFYYSSGVVMEVAPVLVGGTIRLGLETDAIGGPGFSKVNSTGTLSLGQWYRVLGSATVAADGVTWSQTVTAYVGDTMTVAATVTHSGANYIASHTVGAFGIGDINDLDLSVDFRIDDLVISVVGVLSNAPYAIAIAIPNTDVTTQWTRHGSPAASTNAANVGDFPGSLQPSTNRWNQATATGQVDRLGVNAGAIPNPSIRRAYVYVYGKVDAAGPLTVRVWDENGNAVDGPAHTVHDFQTQLTNQMLQIYPGTPTVLAQYAIGYVASGGISGGTQTPSVYHQWINVEYDPTS